MSNNSKSYNKNERARELTRMLRQNFNNNEKWDPFNAQYETEAELLKKSIKSSNPESVKALQLVLSTGGKPTLKDLFEAINIAGNDPFDNVREMAIQKMEIILNHSPELINKSEPTKNITPLLFAILQKGLGDKHINVLLQYGANIDVQDADGLTALHHAAMQNRSRWVRLLLDAGAEPLLENKKGKTPHNYTTSQTLKNLLPRSNYSNENRINMNRAVEEGSRIGVREQQRTERNRRAERRRRRGGRNKTYKKKGGKNRRGNTMRR